MKVFLIPVLQGALVSTVHVSILSMDDLNQSVIGQQITPGFLAGMGNAYTLVMDNVMAATNNGRLSDKQPFFMVH